MPTSICVTICTRERPKMLSRCLDSVLPQLHGSPLVTSLVIVENSDQPSCRNVVLGLRDRFSAVRIEYVLEQTLGIPFARNAAVDAALRLNADWIVFIDDDEIAQPDWFERLTSAIGEWDADVFHGPAELVYPEDHPEWMRIKRFDGGQSGTLLDTAATNNTMARSHLFSKNGLGLRFDVRLRFTGGEDVELFRRATKAGAIIRWVEDASVAEHVSEHRITAKWLLERSRREAANASTFLIAERGFGTALRTLAAKCGRLSLEMAFYATMAGFTFAQQKIASEHIFKTRNKFSKLVGYLTPLSGHSPEGYRSVEGE